MASNLAGNNARQLANRRYLLRVALGLAAIGLLLLIMLDGFKSTTFVGFLSCLLAMFGLEKLVDPLLNKLIHRERQAERGAKAEETVGAILDRLPTDTHRVLHAVSKQFGDIDHLVFRSDGAIFVIETKSHHGEITVENGQLRRQGRPFEKNFIKQALDNTSWVKSFTAKCCGFEPRWIHAVIVFTNAYVPIHCQVSNVAVIRPNYLERWMSIQSGNAQAQQGLWPHIDKIKAQIETSAD